MSNQVVIVGGGLAGLSAAHAVIERGGSVLVLDKMSFLGGNSTKATSGINGALTRTQQAKGIPDSAQIFEQDIHLSYWAGDATKAASVKPHPLVKRTAYDSAPCVDWLIEKFGLDLSLVGQLGGHSFPRTHRGKEKFPGMTITYALMEALEKIADESKGTKARIITKARVTKLLKDSRGAVIGAEYEKDGVTQQAYGPVVVATGGFGADFSENSLLRRYRPDLLALSTTNGDHCTGDGVKFGEAAGAGLIDMKAVQVHPTGLVDPKEPDAKIKFLAAEALRGTGALMLDGKGKRFCNELGRRDYVSDLMFKNTAPFRLVLNSKASREIEWHCKHYTGRGLMKRFKNGAELAKDIGISADTLADTFREYNAIAEKGVDKFGKKFFRNFPFTMDDEYHVAIIVPVVHYCMGGLLIDANSQVLDPNNKVISGMYAAGEVAGGVHGLNRLGGNSLLDCVVFGRVAGDSACCHLLQNLPTSAAVGRAAVLARHITGANGIVANVQGDGVNVNVEFDANSNRLVLDIQGGAGGAGGASSAAASSSSATTTTTTTTTTAPAAAATQPPKQEMKVYSLDDVSVHNTEKDCWVVVNGQVLNVTKFLPDHPGGKKAIMLFAGRDASEEFNMLHKPDVIPKYAPDSVIGSVKK